MPSSLSLGLVTRTGESQISSDIQLCKFSKFYCHIQYTVYGCMAGSSPHTFLRHQSVPCISTRLATTQELGLRVNSETSAREEWHRQRQQAQQQQQQQQHLSKHRSNSIGPLLPSLDTPMNSSTASHGRFRRSQGRDTLAPQSPIQSPLQKLIQARSSLNFQSTPLPEAAADPSASPLERSSLLTERSSVTQVSEHKREPKET
jgi:hypothetical protein